MLLLALPAAAQVSDACTTVPALDEALATLASDGWTTVDPDAQLTPEQTDALAWTLMLRYAEDDGGEDTATLLDGLDPAKTDFNDAPTLLKPSPHCPR